MTPAQLDLARRLVSSNKWRWVAGMRVCGEFGHYMLRTNNRKLHGRIVNAHDDGIRLIEWEEEDARKTWSAEAAAEVLSVDLDDYATAAILLRCAMEATNEKQGGAWARIAAEDFDENDTPRVPAGWLIEWMVANLDEGIGGGQADLGTVAATALLAVWGEP